MDKNNLNKDYEIFGKKVAKLREAKNCSQQQLSNALHIPQSTYAGYETGMRKIPLSLVKKISQYFTVTVDYLLDMEEEPANSSTISAAAHHDGEDWTEEELEYLNMAKKMILEKRKQKSGE